MSWSCRKTRLARWPRLCPTTMVQHKRKTFTEILVSCEGEKQKQDEKKNKCVAKLLSDISGKLASHPSILPAVATFVDAEIFKVTGAAPKAKPHVDQSSLGGLTPSHLDPASVEYKELSVKPLVRQY
eukprot:4696228-Amphidinium_carterae.3